MKTPLKRGRATALSASHPELPRPPAERSTFADEHSAPIGVVPRENVGSSTSATAHTPQGNTNPISVAYFSFITQDTRSPVNCETGRAVVLSSLEDPARIQYAPRLADAQKTDGRWTESSRIFHEMLGGMKAFTARKGELVFLKGDSSKDIRAQIHERLGPTHESVSNISLPLPVAQFDKHPELLKKRIWVRVSDESSSDITTWSFAPQHVVVFIEVEGDASFNFAYRQHDLHTRSMSKRAVFCSWLSSCQETYRAAEAGPSWSSPPRLSGHKPAAIAVPPRIDIEALPLTRLGGLCESFLNLVGTMNDLVKPSIEEVTAAVHQGHATELVPSALTEVLLATLNNLDWVLASVASHGDNMARAGVAVATGSIGQLVATLGTTEATRDATEEAL
ncbi:hypothetical protein A1Q1_00385 [Trichosporon asahii var. asahii CBS 2479]|uniref:Uncharacterized protein n=1 Tax=Trichosporon asahii var. asahii (strain ATCC 90039 / CBS 2479 / JCM 2466 / KCTC 7840 / NBRC 103889/ NCYC 2677 / UAMH 7654) TaxID=1186058 RepID=J4UFY9_TRIAS|nr:hypothetical protein A1Q1_00385 [Trichosporon asahii var. asahii CBS 2479]EJT50330.1 hypothetical protein A1Q1_00385 [Trichosporon asahii var. asahii CBS 2479]